MPEKFLKAGILAGLCFILWPLTASGQTGNGSPHGKNFNLACETCHSAENWQVQTTKIKFNHSQTGFPLSGQHRFADCRSCHLSLEFQKTGSTCLDCHEDVHQSRLGADCQNCHNTQSWENRREMNDQHWQSNFPLTGPHAQLDCQSCHQGQQETEFGNTSTECKSCHLDTYLGTMEPRHQSAGFSLDCQNCHQPQHSDWQQAVFEHSAAFPLTNAHSLPGCSDCHSSDYANTDAACVACHQPEYQAAKDPDHAAFGFPNVCESCHNTSAWEEAGFDHATQSGFALNGAHAQANCLSCHINNQVSGLPRDCIGCHQTDYQAETNPDHQLAGFDTNCLSCHNENTFSPSSWLHTAQTGYEITGAHLTLDCQSCHSTTYSGTSAECVGCHQSDYNDTVDPNHVTGSFPTDCNQCHSTTAWEPATFDHNLTNFQLTGAHTTADCQSCHSAGYSNTPTDCFTCHETDFRATTDPDHETENFSTDCTQCHSTSNWDAATFDHTPTSFPLTGAHTTADCQSCHSAGYSNTPTDCFACHETDYNGTTDPNHVSAGFPVNCQECHSEKAWDPSTFDHDAAWFPIYSGKHLGEWDNCADCHNVPADYKQFECINCHEHNQSEMDDKHKDESGYAYNSQACYNCHPKGRE